MSTVPSTGSSPPPNPRSTRAPRFSYLALGLLLTITVLFASVVRFDRTAPTAKSTDHDSLLIFHQQTQVPPKKTSPAYVASNIDYIESLPFDGITVDIPASLTLMRGEPISYSEMYDDGLAPLKDRFTRMKDNFVMVYIDDPGDVFNDQAWAVTVDNWRNLARAVRDAGLTGIFFDNEPYRDPWANYPEDYDSPTHSLDDYVAQTEQRGKEIMAAMVAEFPDIKLLVFHGPYASEPQTPPAVRRNQAGLASERELVGPFFVGFLEGLGPQATLIDGGEVYQYRTVDDFRQSYDWRKEGIASDETDSAFIPPFVRAIWPDRVSISFGVYTQPYADEEMNPSIMQTTLANALNQADDYVWLYTEDHTWLSPGGIPEAWEDAIRAAVDAARSPEKGLLTTANATARTMAEATLATRRRRPAQIWRKAA
jgi:hypothetical protein